MSFLETSECAVEARPGVGIGSRSRASEVEVFAKSKLELAGRLFREGNSHNLADLCLAFGDDPHDSADKGRRLARARGGLDDKRRVEGGLDELP